MNGPKGKQLTSFTVILKIFWILRGLVFKGFDIWAREENFYLYNFISRYSLRLYILQYRPLRDLARSSFTQCWMSCYLKATNACACC